MDKTKIALRELYESVWEFLDDHDLRNKEKYDTTRLESAMETAEHAMATRQRRPPR